MIEASFVPYKDLVRKTIICPYLGDPRKDKSGVVLKVKCRCGDNKEVDVLHVEHECLKYGRCLPTMERHFDKDHEMESKIFILCKFCSHNKNNVNS